MNNQHEEDDDLLSEEETRQYMEALEAATAAIADSTPDELRALVARFRPKVTEDNS